MRLKVAGIVLASVLGMGVYADSPRVLSLAGAWAFRLDPDGQGTDQGWQRAAYDQTVWLPGSLNENAKGTRNTSASRAYLSPLYEYVGPAWFQREVEIPGDWAGRPLEVFLERSHWETRLWVDDRLVGVQDSLCTPHVYAVGTLTTGKHRLTLRVDNSVKYTVGLRAHSITEHTQTNWNGVVGRMELRALATVGITSIQVFPDAAGRTATIETRLNNTLERQVLCRVDASALGMRKSTEVTLAPGSDGVATTVLDLGTGAPLWDEFDPRLIDLDVGVKARVGAADITDARSVRFGLRDMGRTGSQFTLNGRPYSVRGTLECCIFPLTGYPAMDTGAWRHMMDTARQYGLNHFRFHSWCPPEAAFIAADEAGITCHVETPVWTELGKDPQLDQYVRDEADRILKAYGNHPSFAMLAVGNEPSGPNKDAFLTAIVKTWKEKDARHLYAACAGWPELPASDYHVLHQRNGKPYRLHAGPLGPSTDVDYRGVLDGCPQPAIAHELGQWCVYPDYREIPLYTGSLRARNLEGFRESLRRNDMLDQAHDFAWASGKLQCLMYKADIETVLRTPGAGGFQLLSLQDFPGQGSALIGFLDAFWNAKSGTSPDEFRRFCSETVPLLRIDKRVWSQRETITARAEIAHYGAAPILRARPCWSARTVDGREVASGQWGEQAIPLGNGIALGEFAVPLAGLAAPAKITLSVFLAGTTASNSWDVWVYPEQTDKAGGPRDVLVACEWSKAVVHALRRGRPVLLLPKHIASLRAVKSSFEPIFWNTQWFPGQNRQLGILCDPRHPAFDGFPNDGYTDWQWWELLNGSRVVRLDGLDPAFRPLVQVIDDWNKNRRLGAIFEGRVGNGRLLVCTLDLQKNLDQRPAAAALRRSLLRYMASDAFAPGHELSESWLKEVFAPDGTLIAQIEADSAAAGFGPENAVDGNSATCWHTPWEGNAPGFPHELRIYFTRGMTIAGLRYLPRQDVANGFVGRFEIYAAKDGRNWGQPIVTGEFSPGQDRKKIHFKQPVKTRWLRFVALSNQSGEPFAAVAELEPLTVGKP